MYPSESYINIVFIALLKTHFSSKNSNSSLPNFCLNLSVICKSCFVLLKNIFKKFYGTYSLLCLLFLTFYLVF